MVFLVGQRKREGIILERKCELMRQRKSIVGSGNSFGGKIELQTIDREIGLLDIELKALSEKTKNKTYGRIEAMVEMVDSGEGPKFSEIIIKDRSSNKKPPNIVFVSKDTELACKLMLAKVNSVVVCGKMNIRILSKDI